MKIKSFFFMIILIMNILFVVAESHARGWQGCCSWHGGITYQCVNGRMLCRDGTLSPSCFCNGGYTAPLYNTQPQYNQTPRKRKKATQTNTPSPAPSYNYRGRNQYRDWTVSPFVNLGNTSADFEIYTEYKGSSFREQFSKLAGYTGGAWKGPHGKEYYISYVFITNMPQGSNIKLWYSFNQERSFIQANVLKYDYTSGKINVYFQPKDIESFYNQCRRGSTITLKVADDKGETWTRFVLYGYTRASNDVYQRLN